MTGVQTCALPISWHELVPAADLDVAAVEEVLRDVIDPELGINVVDLGLLYGVTIEPDGTIVLDMTLTTAACPLTDLIEEQAQQAARAQDQGPQRFVPAAGSYIKHVIGVVSGKGGVGKSLVAGALAASLARRNNKVAILDANITGPSIPKMFGLSGEHATAYGERIIPVTSKGGIKIMSTNLVLENETDPIL